MNVTRADERRAHTDMLENHVRLLLQLPLQQGIEASQRHKSQGRKQSTRSRTIALFIIALVGFSLSG